MRASRPTGTVFRAASRPLAGASRGRRLLATLEPLAGALESLAKQIRDILEAHVKTTKMSGNADQTERHIQNSNQNPKLNLN